MFLCWCHLGPVEAGFGFHLPPLTDVHQCWKRTHNLPLHLHTLQPLVSITQPFIMHTPPLHLHTLQPLVFITQLFKQSFRFLETKQLRTKIKTQCQVAMSHKTDYDKNMRRRGGGERIFKVLELDPKVFGFGSQKIWSKK